MAPSPSRQLLRRAVVLSAGALASMVSAGPMIGGTISLFILPVSREFGWARSVFPMAILGAACVGGLVAPLAGRAIDRLGARSVMLAGLLVFGLAHVLLAFSDGSRLCTFAVYMLLGASSSFSGTIGVTKFISALFHANRGRALGLSVGVGAGLGAAVTPLIAETIIHAEGWRAAYLALGVYVWILAIPVVWFLFPRVDVKAEPSAVAMPSDIGLSFHEALRTREFWLLLALIVFNGLAVGGITGHWAPIQVEQGVSLAVATGLLSAFGLIKVAAQFAGGVLLDNVQSPKMALVILTPVVLGVALFAFGSGLPALTTASVLFGLGEGAELGLVPYLISRYFGLRRFGEVLGYLSAAFILSSGLSNVLMGWFFDLTGNYRTGLTLATGAVALAAVAASALGPYRFALIKTPRRETPRETPAAPV